MPGTHKDITYVVLDAEDKEHTFTDPKEANAKALAVAIETGEADLDVLAASEDGARAYGGNEGAERYLDTEGDDPVVLERFAITVDVIDGADLIDEDEEEGDEEEEPAPATEPGA